MFKNKQSHKNLFFRIKDITSHCVLLQEDSTPMLVVGFLLSAVGLLLLGPAPLLGFPPGYR